MNDSADIIVRLAITFALLAIWALVLGGGLWLMHFLLSLPLRRAERARSILDLIETALQRGEPVEQTLISIAHSRDPSLGVRFHLFVAWLEKGLRLDAAFAKVPRLLPPQIVAMLKAGARVGDLRKTLPACRQLLADSVSETRSALNYLVIITFVVSPATITIFSIMAVIVFPKFNEVGAGLGVDHASSIAWLMTNRHLLVGGQVALQFIMWLAAVAYVAGPRFRSFWPGYDVVSWQLPWRRKRMQRDFSILLATLLDNGMPETEAVQLAAECTANRCFQARATRIIAALQQGQSLSQAMASLDDSGEFRWRLTNAAHSQQGFLTALAGWHEALNAKAFQQQQASAHLISSAFVVLNGIFVAAVVISVFAFLISIINTGILW